MNIELVTVVIGGMMAAFSLLIRWVIKANERQQTASEKQADYLRKLNDDRTAANRELVAALTTGLDAVNRNVDRRTVEITGALSAIVERAERDSSK